MLQGHRGCVVQLRLRGVRCGVDPPCSLISLVAVITGKVLILDKGCVLEAPSTGTTTPQRAVVRRLYIMIKKIRFKIIIATTTPLRAVNRPYITITILGLRQYSHTNTTESGE